MIELLAPAGNMEKLKTAIYFGANACYFAGKQFGLRAFSDNFDLDELKESVDYCHAHNVKAFITINILAKNSDFEGLKDYVVYLEKIGVDAVIVSDIGVIDFIRKHAPKLVIHVSTQANVTNKYSAKFLVDMGVKRIILARELSLEEIKEIRDYIPEDIELECFVHGAMCISYSGRCLLSNYLTGRESNRGACVQACRWEYSIREKHRKGEYYDIEEDDRGTYILNSKDMCMIEHIEKLREVGVTSFKIEGRMKSPYYVATVVNAYRRAIDILESNSEYACPTELVAELEKASHRRYTTGFFLGDNNKECLESSMPVQTHEFMAVVLEDSNNGKVLVEMRNRFKIGETLEVLSPNNSFNQQLKLEKMTDEKGVDVLDANQVQQKLYLYTDLNLKAGDILRKEVEKK
jgi:putative protease